MFTACIGMEIAPVGSVKHVQSISCVAGGVTVNKIQIYSKTITMRHVDQFFQLLRRSIAAVHISTNTCMSQCNIYTNDYSETDILILKKISPNVQ